MSLDGNSYKTNYTPYICKPVKNLGGYAEVVSDMEYQVALQIGYSANHIVYNGPVKGPLMERHILNGGILNRHRKRNPCHGDGKESLPVLYEGCGSIYDNKRNYNKVMISIIYDYLRMSWL